MDSKGNITGAIETLQDFTELKKAENALQIANAYNRSLIEASIDPLVIIDPEGKITDVNAATELVTGYSREELIGTDFSNHFTDPEMARAGYLQVLQEGQVRDYSLGIQHKDGHVTPVLYNATVYRDDAGKITGVFAAARDITERTRAEEALKKSEELLAGTQQISHIGSWEWDIVNDKVIWSEETYRLFGWKPQEVEVNYDTYINRVHPEDRDRVNRLVRETLEDDKPYNNEHRIIRVDGAVRIHHTIGKLFRDKDNKPVRLLGAVRDITERKRTEKALKKSEERNRLLVETMNEGLAVQVGDGLLTYVNEKFSEMRGYSRSEMIGHTVYDFLDEENKRIVKAELAKREEGKIAPYELVFTRKDGRKVHTLISPALLQDDEGNFKGSFAVISDITKQKLAEDALRASTDRLKTILDAVQAGVVIIDAETHEITDANLCALDMICAPREEVLGSVCHQYICPAERGNCPITDNGLTVDNSERVLLNVNGESVPILKTVIPIFLGGRRHLLESFVDINDRKRAEEKQLQLLSELARANKDLKDFAYIVSHDLKAPLRGIVH